MSLPVLLFPLQSDNSYDYLSVEEKECLMFLEETIGSLDAEADSGVSTDETDYVEPSKLPGTWSKRDSGPWGKLETRPPALVCKGTFSLGCVPLAGREGALPRFYARGKLKPACSRHSVGRGGCRQRARQGTSCIFPVPMCRSC